MSLMSRSCALSNKLSQEDGKKNNEAHLWPINGTQYKRNGEGKGDYSNDTAAKSVASHACFLTETL